jgi:hypothetical protein
MSSVKTLDVSFPEGRETVLPDRDTWLLDGRLQYVPNLTNPEFFVPRLGEGETWEKDPQRESLRVDLLPNEVRLGEDGRPVEFGKTELVQEAFGDEETINRIFDLLPQDEGDEIPLAMKAGAAWGLAPIDELENALREHGFEFRKTPKQDGSEVVFYQQIAGRKRYPTHLFFVKRMTGSIEDIE